MSQPSSLNWPCLEGDYATARITRLPGRNPNPSCLTTESYPRRQCQSNAALAVPQKLFKGRLLGHLFVFFSKLLTIPPAHLCSALLFLQLVHTSPRTHSPKRCFPINVFTMPFPIDMPFDFLTAVLSIAAVVIAFGQLRVLALLGANQLSSDGSLLGAQLCSLSLATDARLAERNPVTHPLGRAIPIHSDVTGLRLSPLPRPLPRPLPLLIVPTQLTRCSSF